MATMTIDVEALDALSGDLAGVVSEFDDANAKSDEVSGGVGHAVLAETVRNFAHKWDDTRAKMAETVTALSQASADVAAAWRDADQQGADVLNGQDSGSGQGK